MRGKVALCVWCASFSTVLLQRPGLVDLKQVSAPDVIAREELGGSKTCSPAAQRLQSQSSARNPEEKQPGEHGHKRDVVEQRCVRSVPRYSFDGLTAAYAV